MEEQSIIMEPCPINGKDLYGDRLFEDIFDNGSFTMHPKKDSVAVGFIEGVSSRARYLFGDNVLLVNVCSTILDAKCKDITKRLTDVVDMFNEEEKDRQLIATLEQGCDKHYRIIYNYWYNEEDM
jgi:hypothetical protein